MLASALPKEASAHELDDLVQVESVSHALEALGYEVEPLWLTLDLERVRTLIQHLSPAFVFNLVESVDGKGRLIHLGPALLDSLKIPYTGCPTEALLLCSNKLLAKRILLRSGLPTPQWLTIEDLPQGFRTGQTLILKSIWEHASTGLDEDAVIQPVDPGILAREMAARGKAMGGGCFAELYIDGREFNVSILDGARGPQVLPVAEILFQGYGCGRPRIVSYKAKWDPQSFEYSHTPRSFQFCDQEKLVPVLEELALECWNLFGLRGYARVDFRVDTQGRPWILEVNPNPCISPDGGFLAAAARAGLDSREVVARILEASGIPPRCPIVSGAHGRTHGDGGTLAEALRFRLEVRPEDAARVREIVESSGLFTPQEVAVAVELVEERLSRGAESGYHFVFAEMHGIPVAYACLGPIPCTASSFDLYWIVVDRALQGKGIGKALLIRAEELVRKMGGRRLYVETSSRLDYQATRQFYAKHGYSRVALLPNFYSPGDHKLILVRDLG